MSERVKRGSVTREGRSKTLPYHSQLDRRALVPWARDDNGWGELSQHDRPLFMYASAAFATERLSDGLIFIYASSFEEGRQPAAIPQTP